MPLPYKVKKGMDTQEGNRGTLRFTLFGIPVEIRLSTWILLLLLGGGLGIHNGDELTGALIFIVAGLLCLLVHEMGHATVVRAYTRCTPWIVLGGLGGATYYQSLPQTRTQEFMVTFAGPLASFLLGAVIAVLMGLQCGDTPAGLFYYMLMPFDMASYIPEEHLRSIIAARQEGTLSDFALLVYHTNLLVCMWWSIFNLLPILPMDGGHLLRTATDNIKLTATVGLVLSLALLLWGLSSNRWFLTILMTYFALINLQVMTSGGQDDA